MRQVEGLGVEGDLRTVSHVRRQRGARPRRRRRHRRRLPPARRPGARALVGRGVFYGAAVSEAPSMTGEPVFVVGGGNSAGQAALHLAKYARHVTLLVRGPSLAASMSDYLIAQLEATRNVTHPLPGGGPRRPRGRRLPGRAHGRRPGGGRHRGARGRRAVRPDRLGAPDVVAARGGAAGPRPGSSAPAPTRTATRRPGCGCRWRPRCPGCSPSATSGPGSIKRVATAVGDGATVIALLHGYLAEHPLPAEHEGGRPDGA